MRGTRARPFRVLAAKENAVSKEHPPRPDNKPSKSAKDAQNEDAGKIRSRQVTDRNSLEKDLPRGSEPETRGTSGRR